MRKSSPGDVSLYWAPGTKAFMVDFDGSGFDNETGSSHGNGSASVSAGTIHGTCPECLVVMIPIDGGDYEAASNWAMSQPWIDVVTNSWGISRTG